MKVQILHVSGNEFPHDDVVITGSPSALSDLAEQIKDAIQLHKGGWCIEHQTESNTKYIDSHGEVYSVIVKLKPEDVMKQEPPPYNNPAPDIHPNIPTHLYLQVCNGDSADPEEVLDTNEMSWCASRIYDTDVRYIREDLAK